MQLVGYIDGVEVSFDFTPPNKFTANIPKQLDGTYIVQLKAIDDAGNTADYSNIFIKIDFKQLNIKVLPSSYEIIQNSKDFSFGEIEPDIAANILDYSYKHRELGGYYYRELVQ